MSVLVLEQAFFGRFDALALPRGDEWHIVVDEALSGPERQRAIDEATKLIEQGRPGCVRSLMVHHKSA